VLLVRVAAGGCDPAAGRPLHFSPDLPIDFHLWWTLSLSVSWLAVDFVNGFNGIGFSSLKRYRWAYGDKWLSMDHLESFCLVLHSTPHLIVSREMERTETLHTIMMRLAHSVGR
jgi:hypothetical protein